MLGDKVKTLAEAKAAIDACFQKYAHKAVAVKSQCAYWRSLNFLNAGEEEAEPVFKRYAAGDVLSPEEHEVMQGHLFHYCMKKAAETNLVVKLHTGYYAGHGGMPLARVRDNVSDLCPVFKEHPDTKFSLFHIAYPYQEEIIAVAKQYANVYADMCWAWIINPAASVRFLKEFIMAAPVCKLFTFGGDYLPVEMTVGHAAIARRGIAQAVIELVQEGWLMEEDVPDLVTRIMCGNAREVFGGKKNV
jgi:predicted TIM-barrel fold metal-dependent hydrolase